MLKKKHFGKGFKWGVAISAFQNEGAAFIDGKTASIWDTLMIFKPKKELLKFQGGGLENS